MTIDQAFFDKLATLYSGEDSEFPWYCYTVLVFQVNDQMDLVGETWKGVLKHMDGDFNQLKVARQMREALLKASVLVGFPKVRS
jgi:hypothetical protein